MKVLDAADRVSGGNLKRFVKRRRVAGWSYQAIAQALKEQYGVEVTDTTVRDFCQDHHIS